MNSCVGNVHVKPFGNYAFRENRCSESQTSVKDVNSAQEMSTEIVRLCAFVKTVERKPYFINGRTRTRIYPCLLHFKADTSEILRKRSAQNSAESL